MQYLDYPSFVFGGAFWVLVFVVVPWLAGKALDRLARCLNDDV